MIETPVGRHILRKEERLFQSLSQQACMTLVKMPKYGINRDERIVNLKYG